jgi:hypothetical protein
MLLCVLVRYRAGIAQTVQRLATGWTVRGSNPGVGEIFRRRNTDPWAHPASCTMGKGSFPGVKRPGPGVYHPFLMPRSSKSRAIPLPPLGLRHCYWVSLPLPLSDTTNIVNI